MGTRNELNMPLRICVRCRDVPQKEAAAPSSGGKRRDTCELVLHVSSSSGTASKIKLDLRAKVPSYGFVEKDGSALEGEGIQSSLDDSEWRLMMLCSRELLQTQRKKKKIMPEREKCGLCVFHVWD